MILILLGYRGSGKTSLGRYLSKVWGIDFTDTDEQIVEVSGKSVPQLFSTLGEDGFRDLETQILKDCLKMSHGIIATGGGIVEREVNRKLIAEQNSGIYLYEKAKVLYERIRGDKNRPALTDLDGLKEVETVLQRRDPWYREVSRWVIPTEGYNLNTMEQFLYDLLNRETEFFRE